MKLELEVYSSICESKVFQINGVKASTKDFGDKHDQSPDKKRLHQCGNMIFVPKRYTEQILDKYLITATEYGYVCDKLHDLLSFSLCRLCG